MTLARILVTGSSDGLGLLAAKQLAAKGHQVTLHARNEARADVARRALRKAEGVLIGDFATLAGMRQVVDQANITGRFDAVIHNAGIGYNLPSRVAGADNIEQHFAVNVLAPYLLTATMTRPKRLIYLSSGLHRGGHADLHDLRWETRRWNGLQAYSDTKLFDVVLAYAVARRWPSVIATAVEPGWVATKMGGAGAPDDLEAGAETQVWLATSMERAAMRTSTYWYHKKHAQPHAAVHDVDLQEGLLDYCASLTGARINSEDLPQ